MTKILHLTLKKKWFDLIASEEKKIEYREIKPYWERRFFNIYLPLDFDGKVYGKNLFDEIYFRNGYKKDSPFMRVEWKGFVFDVFEGKHCFAIQLGKILEIKK